MITERRRHLLWETKDSNNKVINENGRTSSRKRRQNIGSKAIGLGLFVISLMLSSCLLRKSSFYMRHLNHYMQQDMADFLSINNMTAATPTDNAVPSVQAGQTMIIAACDYAFKDMALAWYEKLTKLGYNTHMILAVDQQAADFFRQHGLRHDMLLPPLRDGEKDAASSNYCYQEHSQNWMYRRVVFGMRWHYVLGLLENGHHVLMTDIDNIFVRHHSLSNMEESAFDVFHTYAMPYPANVYEKLGYTVCGCLTWLRSSPESLNFVKALLNRCQQPGSSGMECFACDDQVEVNKLYMGYKRRSSITLEVPDDFGEQGFWKSSISGRVHETNHTFYLWDADLAYRGPIRGIEGRCPGQSNSTHEARNHNWMAAPTTSTKKRTDAVQDRQLRLTEWGVTCGISDTNTDPLSSR
jgi:hypothetical protein